MYRETDCQSFYHLATKKRKAWIELIVDNILGQRSRLLMLFTVEIERRLGRALYHEISHHLDARCRRHGNREDAAEQFGLEQWRVFFQTKYRLFVPILRLILRAGRRLT
jgi:hypothetical protein